MMIANISFQNCVRNLPLDILQGCIPSNKYSLTSIDTACLAHDCLIITITVVNILHSLYFNDLFL